MWWDPYHVCLYLVVAKVEEENSFASDDHFSPIARAVTSNIKTGTERMDKQKWKSNKLTGSSNML